ncbi:glycosyl transferase [Marinitoga sp. 1135]|uniref:UDP-N-acetylmuramyl pentapeptide phosphotransferase/UDP-N-acetylglucosamine-1-phosphate transferase n=1 Tax=Marinitoga piezophila (strain DSM 14283 / JCM 11233 / KA3) TaxID=443254 RepID=H2J3D3_MARPK|nr:MULTISPECIES: MraY family glycosyltransferase [Marinitoga]AEX85749.1 UDP-N-acetylmuramyl pentapeptide phosphotransferase/UDP-N-acetylglucosamine-1-phosphate transferase [Marinitoga piezophila KA3]APT76194.1 glycosyl transferase [Marinitoga sp. 1137]NUU95953.1 glycosyl transferase [Marinitoga sp. 1135]NUU97864.1 glycosyl transferase [Marinitoga sp. 1138]
MHYLGVFFLSIIITYIMIPVAKNMGIVDKPDETLKIHEKATPYLGGLAIYLSSIFFIHDLKFVFFSSLLMFLGLIDDIKDVSPKIRLLVEFVIIIATLIPFYSTIGIIYFFLLIILGVALINAVNMIDGMDGICGGNTLFVILFLSIISKQYDYIFIVAAIAGFLIFNFYPAKIFLGDAGSYFLAYTIFYLMVIMTNNHGFGGFAISVIVSALFYTDLFFSFLRRILNHRSPFSGDRDHIYDKIKKRYKISVKTTAIITYVFSFLFGIIGIISWDYPYLGVSLAFLEYLFLGIYFKLYSYD